MTEGPKAAFPGVPETGAGEREAPSTERQQDSQAGRGAIATSPTAPATSPHGIRARSDTSKVTRVGIVAGLSGMVAGFVMGYGVASRPASSSHAPTITSAASASPANPLVPAGPADLVLDLGTDEAQRALQGPWTKAELSQRSVALATGPGTSIEITLSPAPSKYGLAVVAKANGISAGETLDVTLRLNRREVGAWKIGADWDMHALVLEATSFTAGKNVLDLVLAAAGKQGPGVAIDTLHLAPLSSRAEAGMATLEPRGSLIDGYYGKEGEGAQASTWSAGLKTRIGLLLAPLNAEYDVQLEGAAFGPLQPLNVEVIVNSKSVGIAKVDNGPRYVFHAPPGAFTPGLNIVELVYPKTLRPSDSVKGSDDQRDLAIRIFKVMAAPAATPLP